MSDSTANAREPSMEDILASIRRIIDEEDTRDGRPSSDSPVDDDGLTDEVGGAMPVMAPAAANRDPDAGAAVAEDGADGDEEAIFPERESLFWSRATGRGAPVPGSSDGDDDDEASGGIGGMAMAGAAAATAGAAAVGGSATDIFTRAQNKLGSSGRSSSTRERMQSLAARTASRAEEAAEDVREPVEDLADLDLADLDGVADIAEDTLPDFSAVEDAAMPDVLELTDAVEMPEMPETDSGIDSLVSRVGTDVEKDEDIGTEPGSDAGVRADAVAEEPDAEDFVAAFEASLPPSDAGGDGAETQLDEVVEAVGEAAGDATEQDEVFDLTTPLDTGRADPVDAVEDAADDTVESVGIADIDEVEALAEPEADRDGLPEIGPGERLEDDYSARFYGEAEDDEDDAAIQEAVSESHEPEHDGSENRAADAPDAEPQGHDDAPEEELPQAGSLTSGEAYEVGEVETADGTVDETAVETKDDTEDSLDRIIADESPAWGGGFSTATLAAGAAAAGTATALHGSKDDEGQDASEMDEPLGFSDTFSASDVYHDDPPVLDDDYSASLDRDDEPVLSRTGFAGEDAFEDEPSAVPHPDDEMDKVGGLVRDAMERDPVDYADPSALVSMSSEEISARALASLADVEGEASRRMYGALRIGDNGESESIEGMVKGMLRPMLREWLDDNLPNMVETMVRGEVERISAKSRKYSRASDED